MHGCCWGWCLPHGPSKRVNKNYTKPGIILWASTAAAPADRNDSFPIAQDITLWQVKLTDGYCWLWQMCPPWLHMLFQMFCLGIQIWWGKHITEAGMLNGAQKAFTTPTPHLSPDLVHPWFSSQLNPSLSPVLWIPGWFSLVPLFPLAFHFSYCCIKGT